MALPVVRQKLQFGREELHEPDAEPGSPGQLLTVQDQDPPAEALPPASMDALPVNCAGQSAPTAPMLTAPFAVIVPVILPSSEVPLMAPLLIVTELDPLIGKLPKPGHEAVPL